VVTWSSPTDPGSPPARPSAARAFGPARVQAGRDLSRGHRGSAACSLSNGAQWLARRFGFSGHTLPLPMTRRSQPLRTPGLVGDLLEGRACPRTYPRVAPGSRGICAGPGGPGPGPGSTPLSNPSLLGALATARPQGDRKRWQFLPVRRLWRPRQPSDGAGARSRRFADGGPGRRAWWGAAGGGGGGGPGRLELLSGCAGSICRPRFATVGGLCPSTAKQPGSGLLPTPAIAWPS